MSESLIEWTHARDAWLVREVYLRDRPQVDIATDLDITSSLVGTRIAGFCERWSSGIMGIYGENRRMIAISALNAYLSTGGSVDPPIYVRLEFSNAEYSMARGEHATLCRAENETWSEVGSRLGVCRSRAREIQLKFARRMRRALVGVGWDITSE